VFSRVKSSLIVIASRKDSAMRPTKFVFQRFSYFALRFLTCNLQKSSFSILKRLWTDLGANLQIFLRKMLTSHSRFMLRSSMTLDFFNSIEGYQITHGFLMLNSFPKAGQILHSVANDSPPLQHQLCCLGAIDAEMDRLVTRFGVIWRV